MCEIEENLQKKKSHAKECLHIVTLFLRIVHGHILNIRVYILKQKSLATQNLVVNIFIIKIPVLKMD